MWTGADLGRTQALVTGGISMGLKDLPVATRPREKLIARGHQALSDVELLALLLRTGLPGKNVLMLAQELLDRFQGLAGLLDATAAELQPIKGLGGSAKRAELIAVLELARRTLAQRLQQQPLLSHPQAVKDYLQLQLAARPHEVFAVLFVDSQHRLLALEELFRGTLDSAQVHPREVLLRALHHHAAAVMLAHNHPSGNPQPSSADLALTRHLQSALALVDIRVLDHLIVTPTHVLSLAEQGLL
jgi:DNA repair protein RadC